MQDFTKINVEQICSVTSYYKQKNKYYVYKKAWRFLFFKREEGFYWNYDSGSKPFTKEYFETKKKDCYIEGENVYYKPNIRIKMSNQYTFDKFFETTEELDKFMSNPEMSRIYWIKL